MAQELEFAYEYSRLLTAALERGDRKRAIHYNDSVRQLLERDEELQELVLKRGDQDALPAVTTRTTKYAHALAPQRAGLNENGSPLRGRQSLKV
jgi:hypothetical protein